MGRELTGLADACLATALRLADAPAGMAVVAMGKLGGRELNYASDVDVLFVHDGAVDPARSGGEEIPGDDGTAPGDGGTAPGLAAIAPGEGGTAPGEGEVVLEPPEVLAATEAVAAARRLLAVMNSQTGDGIVFRTDADLRPEGRSGRLSRTVEAFADYYRNWAGHWERQALIKSRFVAGDGALANRFFDAVLPSLWDRPLDPDALREIRAMKARSERLRAEELKRGPGGIRDVEFAVQLLQLAHGRHDQGVRSANTLEALDQLTRGGYLDPADAEHLATAYRYLRRVEHRLQLRDEQQVYALPRQPPARARLARVLGYRDRPDATALEQFEETHRRHLASVRSIHERLFFRPLLDALAGRGEVPADVGEQLAAFGFHDIAATRAAVAELTAGMSRNARQFQALMPLLLQWFSTTPNPDLGLLQLRTVADGPVRASAVVAVLRDSSVAGEHLCRLLGSSKVVGRALRRHPEALADLADEDALSTAKDRLGAAGSRRRRRWAGGRPRPSGEGTGCGGSSGARSCGPPAGICWGSWPTTTWAGELTDLAEATLEAVLDTLDPPFPFTIVGMGKLGGAELSYASDLDVLFVHDGEAAAAERLAEAVIREIGAQTAEGRAWEIDARLRPEGRAGALALSRGRLPLVLRGAGPAVGAPGVAAGPTGGRRCRAGPAIRRLADLGGLRRRPERGRGPGDPSDQGPGRVRADPPPRRSGVPPQAGSRRRWPTWSGPCSCASSGWATRTRRCVRRPRSRAWTRSWRTGI